MLRLFKAVLLIAGLMASSSGLVRAQAPIVVDTVADVVDGDLSAGNYSLREALGNVAAGGTITFDASMTIVLALGELDITVALTIDGDLNDDGNPDVTIDGNLLTRIFNVDDSTAADRPVVLEGLVLTRGRATTEGGCIANREDLTANDCTISGNATTQPSADGGAIWNSGGVLTINRTSLTGNSTTESDGGGIYSQSGSVSVNLSTISGNLATGAGGQGGGIYFVSGGTLEVTDSTIDGNSTTGDNGDGGGIFVSGATSETTITRSTLSRNTVAGVGSDGAGLYSNTEATTITKVVNSTISGNQGTARGGGIFNFDGRTEIRNSTVTDNTTTGSGGGVASVGDTDTFTHVLSSIIAGNAGSDVELVDGATNSFLTLGNNLIGTGNATGAFAPGELLGGGTLGLLPLGNSLGPTETHDVTPASAALDQGSNPDGLSTDQRGSSRNFGLAPDVGSVEYIPPGVPAMDWRGMTILAILVVLGLTMRSLVLGRIG